MTFTEQLAAHDYTKNELILSLFTWSYKNDYRLFCNLDDHFSRHTYSNLVSEDKDNCHRHGGSAVVDLLLHHPDYSPEDVMKLALTKCDYHDSRRFMWTFTAGGSNRNDEYKFKSNEKHRYSFMIDLITTHETALRNKGLDTWRKSLDVEKHKWYRGRIQDYLNKGSYNNRAEFLIVYPGNSVVNQIFDLEIYNEYLQYILDNHIVSDSTKKELTYTPFGAKTNHLHNGYKITSLMEPMGGLIYLTTNEMVEIYNSIPKHKIPRWNKAEWAYIQSLKKNDWDVQFYINLEKG